MAVIIWFIVNILYTILIPIFSWSQFILPFKMYLYVFCLDMFCFKKINIKMFQKGNKITL